MKNNSEKYGKSSTTTSISASKKGKNKCSGSSSNSSNNSSEKPKQPQRGLGVAQLEKIRLHSQMASCGVLPHHHHHHPAAATFLNSPFQNVPEEIRYQLEYQASLQTPPQPFCYPTSIAPPPYGYQHLQNNAMTGMGDRMERAKHMGYNESQFHNSARWNPNNNNVIMIPENYPCTQQPGMVTRHLLSNVERPERNKFFELERANNQKSEASENDELDLELRL